MKQFKYEFKPRFLALASSLIPYLLCALPQNPDVISGDATCSFPDDQTMIIEAGNRAIIQYSNFNVGGLEKVQFIQPSSSSVVLNRIEGGEASSILGRIESNGKVFLVNPKGVYFGKNSQVDVGSLIVSTMGIQDQDFLQDRFQFAQNDSWSSSIINEGNIKASGDVLLLSPHTVNEGSIVAQAGKVSLISGEKVVLNFSDTGLVQFSVDGEMEKALISQSGTLEATEGEVVLRMGAIRKIVESVMNVDGIVEANELIEKDGVICLGKSSNISAKSVAISAQKGSKLIVDGKITVSNEAGIGGKVQIVGESICLDSAEIQASGNLGGGEVLIGSDSRFKAEEILLKPETRIFASAGSAGPGGKVLISASESTHFNGKIEARGGFLRGDGGFVETTGKASLKVESGSVDTSAPSGKVGTWLIDCPKIEVKKDMSSGSGVHPNSFSSAKTGITLSSRNEEGGISISDSIVIDHPGADITFKVEQSTGKIHLSNCEMKTQGGEILFQGPLQIGGENVSLDTNGASILFEGRVDSGVVPSNLSLSAGKEGSIRFDESIGEDQPLKGLRVERAHDVSFAHDVIVAGGDILFNAPVVLMGDFKIDTTAKGLVERGGNISILQGVDGNNRLHLNAGTSGNITIGKGAGLERALFALHMKAKTINLVGDIKADGGTLTYYGNVLLGGDLTMEDTGPTGITFLGTVDGAHTLTLSAPLGKVSFFSAVGASTALQNLVVASSEIRIKSDVTVTTSFDMNGAVTLLGNSTITSSNIHFEKTLDGLYNLSLDAGSTGTITLDHRAGGDVRLGNLTIINAQTLTTQEIYAKTITQSAGTLSSIFNGVLDTISTGGIQLTGNDFTFAAGIKSANGGFFILNNAGSADFTGNGTMALVGSFSQTGAGPVSIETSIVTAGRNILFTSAVTIPSSISLSTGDQGFGSISFLSTVEGPGSLSLTLGMGDLLFSQNIGQSTALGDVSIISARNVDAEAINATSVLQEAGSGIGTYNGSITTTGLMGISLTSNQLALAGTSSSQILTTSGSGNLVINSLYTDVGSVLSPIQVNVAAGSGTFFEGSSGTVYVASASEVGKFCTVRSNPGCLVLYGTEDVTPNICCAHSPSPPPPPSPCPPCPNACPTPNRVIAHRIFEYIPGIYTNYWIEKDTLGAPWYFDLGLITEQMVSPWKGDLYWGTVSPSPYRISECVR